MTQNEFEWERRSEWEADPLFDFRGFAEFPDFGRFAEWEQPSGCPKTARETVSRFPRYSNRITALPPEEQAKVRRLVSQIVANQRAGCVPFMKIQLVGHADRDLARERREPGFMLRISRERAAAVRNELERLLNNRALSSQIAWDVIGAADRQLVVANPRTELDRQRNRRVEVTISEKPAPPPSDCSAAQKQQTELVKAAAVHYMRTKLGRKEPVPIGVECFDPPTLPYVCDVSFSNNMVIEVEVSAAQVKVILARADDEPGLVNRAPVCKFTYRCPPSGGFVFRETECAT
jgi:outer membrane protein OmpA-like peptidoglycan-associated protein